MNYSQLLFLPIICASLCLSAENIQLLRQAEITKKIKEIEKQVIRDQRILIGLQTLAHAQEIYIFWSLVSPLFTDNTPVQVVGPVCDACKALAEKPIPFTTAVWSGLTTFCHNTKNLFTTSQGWFTIGQWSFYYAACMAALYVALRAPDDFIHPDTLRWYVHTHAPYEATLLLIKDALINLQDQSLESAQRDYFEQLLKDSFNRLARYGEFMCAYMMYKSKHLDEDERVAAERAARHFFTYYNTWLKTIEVYYEGATLDYNGLNKLITMYETEIGLQLRHFYAIEGETKADKRAVLKKE